MSNLNSVVDLDDVCPETMDLATAFNDHNNPMGMLLGQAISNIQDLKESVEKLSPVDMVKPKNVEGFKKRIDKISNDLGMESIDLGYTVSNEGVLETAQKIGKKIWEYISNCFKWIYEKIKYFLKYVRVQGKMMARAAKSISAKTDKTKRDSSGNLTILELELPIGALPIFHSTKHTPKLDFNYSQKHYQEAMKNIEADSKALAKALKDDLSSLEDGCKEILDSIRDDRALNYDHLSLFRKRGRLAGMYNNKFQFIGIRIAPFNMINQTGVRDTKFGFEDVTHANGWVGNSKFFKLTLEYADLPKIAKETCLQADNLSSDAESLYKEIEDSKVFKVLSDANFAIKYRDATGSNLPGHIQDNTQDMLNALYEAATYIRAITQTYGGTVNRYTRFLEATLNSIDKAL